MAETIFHREYKIIADSYQDENGKWAPQARIVPWHHEAVNIEESALRWPQEFDTMEEADDFALDGAEFYIDENY